MVTIHIKKSSDFETRPELEVPRQTFGFLEALIANSPDTPVKNYLGNFRGSYLNSSVALLKANNLRVGKFEETQKVEEGNLILETKIQVHPSALTININLLEIGIVEGRGSYEVKPTQNGFWLHVEEVDCYKNSQSEEAHALKRTIARNYTVNGQYDWQNMHQTLMPDGSLYIAVGQQRHPGMPFPLINQGPVYSSVTGNPGFPPVDPTQTYGKFGGFGQSNIPSTQPPTVSRCCQCGGVKTVGVQTGSSLCAITGSMESYPSMQTPSSELFPPATNSSLQSFTSSWFPCTCDSMEC